MNKPDDVNTTDKFADAEGRVENARRKFLKSAGRFAIYTPPAMMMLMRPSHASILKSADGRPDCDQNEQRGHKTKFKSAHKHSHKRNFGSKHR